MANRLSRDSLQQQLKSAASKLRPFIASARSQGSRLGTRLRQLRVSWRLVIAIFGATAFYGPITLLAFPIGPILVLGYLVVLALFAPWVVKRQIGARDPSPQERDRLAALLTPLLAEVAPPVLYVVPFPAINAIAVGWPRRGGLFVTSASLEQLSDEELQAVLAHEVGHLVSYHSLISSYFAALGWVVEQVARGTFLALQFFDRLTALIIGVSTNWWLTFGLLLFRLCLIIEFYIFRLLFWLFDLLATLCIQCLSREQEFAADAHAQRLGYGPALARALSLIETQGPEEKRSFLTKLLASHPHTEDRIRRLSREELLEAQTCGEVKLAGQFLGERAIQRLSGYEQGHEEVHEEAKPPDAHEAEQEVRRLLGEQQTPPQTYQGVTDQPHTAEELRHPVQREQVPKQTVKEVKAMDGFEYRVVPFIGQVRGAAEVTMQNAQDVANQLQTLINRVVTEGWEFYRIDPVQIQVTPSCLGRLFGQREAYIRFDQLIFRRPQA